MTADQSPPAIAPSVSVAIFAWNEERGLNATLQSLLGQSLFGALHAAGECCEVICVANGCTDHTAEVAGGLFLALKASHPHKDSLSLRVANIPERGKLNAWNQYVHQLSARSASVLFMMDADILIHRLETMANMLATLRSDPEATVAVDVPRKHVAQKSSKSLADRLSLSTSRMTLAADGQLCGQLYCIRAEAARRIYLPKDLAACEDGLIKAFVCTDFFQHAAWPRRTRVAPDAEHTFEAYTTPRAILKNQKRQIMGQTIVHVLVDRYLSKLPVSQRQDLAGLIREKDATDPAWLKRLIREHIQNTPRCWRLYPDLLTNRFARLAKLRPRQRLACLPAALAASCATLAASVLAYRSLKQGCTDYWPKAQRTGLDHTAVGPAPEPNLEQAVSLSRIGGVK